MDYVDVVMYCDGRFMERVSGVSASEAMANIVWFDTTFNSIETMTFVVYEWDDDSVAMRWVNSAALDRLEVRALGQMFALPSPGV